ncbi:MAG: enoyl-CoA hydratase/isomerase family protein [Deltaproteobacteria bacterium]|jgi:enoyl-CoA hydratase/carnithine racemase|nr:enoyl-CoA hydratase/isomerase family protein [Deltaproteobacteria bacterium]
MSTDPVLFEIDDEGVALITLNRPDKLNAMGGRMLTLLDEYYQRCDEDDAVRAVVVTGAGRAFCSGADMSDAARTFDVSSSGGFDDFSAAALDFPAFRIRKLVVAAVNGHAIGLGMTLALQCDIRLFAEEGRYGVVQVRRGVLGDAYSHWTLVRLVGLARAAEIMLTGRTFRGPELDRLGVASSILPAEEVLPAALEIARDTAIHAAPLSVACSKRLLWQSSELTPEEVEHAETELHKHLMPAPDAVEGPVSHVERRRPRWSLRVSQDWPEWPGGGA